MQHNSKAFVAISDFSSVPTAKYEGGLDSSTALTDLAKRLFQISNSLNAFESVVSAAPVELANSNIARLRRIIKVRRARDRYFPSAMFADAQWDILLDLALARLTQKQVMVSSAAIAAAVPTSTALRCIKAMQDNKLVERVNDSIDRRRSYLQISDEAFVNMTAFLFATVAPVLIHERLAVKK